MYSAGAEMWVRLPLATRHKAERYAPRFPGNGVINLPTGQGAATRCCLHKPMNNLNLYADRHSAATVSMRSAFQFDPCFLLRKQTRRGSFDQRAALSGGLECTTLRQIYGIVLVTTPRVGIAERLLLLKISTTVGGAGKPAAAPRSAYGFGKYEWRRN